MRVFTFSMFASLGLTGCDLNQSTYSNVCTKAESAKLTKASKDIQRNKKLSQSLKGNLQSSFEQRRQGIKVNCRCVSRGLSSILTLEEYDELIDEMVNQGTSPVARRDRYLKHIGKSGGKESPYYLVWSNCADYTVDLVYKDQDLPSPY